MILSVRRVVTVALLSLLAGCGGGSAADDAPRPPPDPPVPLVTPGPWVVLGSSTAAGVGATPGQSWPNRLAATMASRQVVLHNLARAGNLTPQALPASAPASAPRPAPDPTLNLDRALGFAPRLILLSFPTNDAVAGLSASETAANLDTLRRAAASTGSATVVMGSQPRAGLNAAQQATLAELDRLLAAQAGSCFLPLHATLANPASSVEIAPAYAAGDGIHLNDAGHARIRELLQAFLEAGRCVRLTAPAG